MKVKNLIDRLQAYPEDMEVLVLDANWDCDMNIVGIENSETEDGQDAVKIVAKD